MRRVVLEMQSNFILYSRAVVVTVVGGNELN